MEIQERYKDYAFIDPSGAGGSEAVAEDIVKTETTKWSITRTYMFDLIKQTYEAPFSWYFVVFAPFNRPYDKDPAWYQFKGMDAARKYFKRPIVIIMTKEVLAAKTHVNALVCTDQKLCSGKNTGKYKLNIMQLASLGDRLRVLTYILKESDERQFLQYQDYVYHPRIM